jgi:hypothetical protein
VRRGRRGGMEDDELLHLVVGRFEAQRLVVCLRSDFEGDYVVSSLVWLHEVVVGSELL